MGNLQIDNYPMIVEDAMSEFICNRFDGVIGFNLVGKGLSFKLDTKDSLLIVTDRKMFFAEEEKGQPTAKYKMKRAYCPLVYVESPIGWIETVFDTGALNRWFDLPQELLDHWFQKSPKKRKQFVFVPHTGQEITVGNSEAGSVSFIPSEAGDSLGVLKAVIRKGSAAYQKGIRTGDYLIEVNGVSIKDLCTYTLMERKDEESLFKFRSTVGIEKTVRLKRTN